MKTTPALFCLFLSLAPFAAAAEVIPADESYTTEENCPGLHRWKLVNN